MALFTSFTTRSEYLDLTHRGLDAQIHIKKGFGIYAARKETDVIGITWLSNYNNFNFSIGWIADLDRDLDEPRLEVLYREKTLRFSLGVVSRGKDASFHFSYLLSEDAAVHFELGEKAEIGFRKWIR